MGTTLQELAHDVLTVVVKDTAGFYYGFIPVLIMFLVSVWITEVVEWPSWEMPETHNIRNLTFWLRRNWLYVPVAMWYMPRMSAIYSFLDDHLPATIVGLMAALFVFLGTMFTADALLMRLVWHIECLVHSIDAVLRGMLNIGRIIVRRFPLQFAALALLIVFAGSVQHSQAEAETQQIVTFEEVDTQPADEPYAPQTTVNGERYVTELVTQSPIVSGHVNDAHVIVETVGKPITIRWIVEGRTAVIDVLSDEPVVIGFSGVGGQDQSIQGKRQSYEHGQLFKLTIPEDWSNPNVTIGVYGDQGSSISINWYPE